MTDIKIDPYDVDIPRQFFEQVEMTAHKYDISGREATLYLALLGLEALKGSFDNKTPREEEWNIEEMNFVRDYRRARVSMIRMYEQLDQLTDS